MKFKIHIILFVLVKVVSVKSECDTYFECLHQFYDGFFGSTINFKSTETQVGDIEVSGFQNVNLEPDNVDSILKTVSSFLKDLVGDFDSKSQINILHNNNNKTFILVKEINIAGDFDDFDEVKNTLKNKTDTNNLSGIKVLASAKQNSDLSSTEHINGITPKSISKSTNNTKPVNIRNPILDINELSKIIKENEIIDIDSYDYINDNSTDYPIIDYIDLYKDTTNEYVEIKPTTVSTYDINEFEKKTPYSNLINVSTYNRVYADECTNATDAIFPWVVAIFVKNETGNQFYYYCDGALLSDTVIITAASCIQTPNATSEDLLVILGKRSLKVTAGNEIIAKIKDVHIYDNSAGSEKDIALLVMNVPVTLSDRVEPARLGDVGDESATTGWAISGELMVIPFEREKDDCNDHLTLNTFCATYGNEVSVCPSYGGLYVTRQSNDWFLSGIRADKPMNKSLCVDRTVVYADLKYYRDWINLYV